MFINGKGLKVLKRVFLFYSRMKMRSKLMLFFTLSGLAVGYFSFMFTVVITTLEFKRMATVIVDEWLQNNFPSGDIIDSFVGKKYNREMGALLPFITLADRNERSGLNIREVNFYIYNNGSGAWYKLYLDKDDVMKKTGFYDLESITNMKEALNKPVKMKNFAYWGRTDNYYLWINITRPGDKNSYIGEFVIGRRGVLHYLGGSYFVLLYALGILIISFGISRIFALHLSRPIQKLSMQADAISKGDFDARIEILSRDEIGTLSTTINTMADELGKRINDIKKRMEAISVMNRIDKAVLSSVSRNDLIDSVTAIVSEMFIDSYISLAMVDKADGRYHLLSHYFKGIRTMPEEEYYISFDRLSPAILERNTGFYILDYNRDMETIEWLNGIVNQDYMHIMNLPIYMDEEYSGSLIIGKSSDTPFTDFEKDTSKALADQTGVAMKSVRYVEEMEKLYLGILLALARTIDAKSKWTAGHSERVAVYSEKIASALGMDSEFINNIKVSASLHDIGKIGVPESILDKEGNLSDEEFDLIKKHPQGGADIIEAIPGYEKFLNGIIFHHEFWNGTGYPFGLNDTKIPLMGRIIAVADVYDSLVSDRPYRKGMACEKAVEILKSEKGRKLDPALVDIMIEIINNR